jgi:hypothetical protein
MALAGTAEGRQAVDDDRPSQIMRSPSARVPLKPTEPSGNVAAIASKAAHCDGDADDGLTPSLDPPRPQARREDSRLLSRMLSRNGRCNS